ncbi:hypothetical protein LOK49_LG07G00981 [Camellia lanceoleosa]|uniref:Uncharacterized protein n=1 Tax=Camellia lanceoleosa TaxID=1840588 RepID=A0ACC0H0V3_9ERIC|nr:hypothetical protein LOK49_LG07G00981 [Camellia lanceoleosa]
MLVENDYIEYIQDHLMRQLVRVAPPGVPRIFPPHEIVRGHGHGLGPDAKQVGRASVAVAVKGLPTLSTSLAFAQVVNTLILSIRAPVVTTLWLPEGVEQKYDTGAWALIQVDGPFLTGKWRIYFLCCWSQRF